MLITLFLLLVVTAFVAYQAYAYIFFSSDLFNGLKRRIDRYTKECNALNRHIEDLKSSQLDIRAVDHGEASLSDTSRYNYQRRNWSKAVRSHQVHNCSSTVCKNANDQPFKYLCKYFDIKTNEDSLSAFEGMLNDFSAAEQGKVLLQNQKTQIIARISQSIPPLILQFSRKRLERELGFEPIDFSDLYVPVYTFQYISAGGNSSMRVDIKMNTRTLEGFVEYLGGLVKFRKSVKGQRALMTSKLREYIKQRDDYSCQACGLSTADEKNLLLEIDHIVPLSKGGITSEDNLQTLCWKCNRSKGSKLI